MSERKSATGDIPDEWFENDTDPAAGKKMEPEGFTQRLLEKLKPADKVEPKEKVDGRKRP